MPYEIIIIIIKFILNTNGMYHNCCSMKQHRKELIEDFAMKTERIGEIVITRERHACSNVKCSIKLHVFSLFNIRDGFLIGNFLPHKMNSTSAVGVLFNVFCAKVVKNIASTFMKFNMIFICESRTNSAFDKCVLCTHYTHTERTWKNDDH